MEPIDSFIPTGRRFAGPVTSLVEMQDRETGWLANSVVFSEDYRDHSALRRPELHPFLEAPTVRGLAELDAWDPDEGAFVYPTGLAWSVAEVLTLLSQLGEVGGVRAGLELCYLGALILEEVDRIAEPHGLYAHGNLNPWHLVLQPDGEGMVLGYGLAPVEFIVWQEDDTLPPPDDVLRYAPPERVEGEPEDLSSDLFSLTLVALELMTGQPLYEGSGTDLLEVVRRGIAKDRVHGLRRQLPPDVVELLGEAVDLYQDSRYRDGQEFIQAAGHLLLTPTIEGPALKRLMARVATVWRRPAALPVQPGAQPGEQPVEEEEKQPRWHRTRPRRKEAIVEREGRRRRAERESAPARDDDTRRGLRRSMRARRDRNAMFPKRPMGDAERYYVSVDGRDPHWTQLDPEQSLAESAARLVDLLCPTPLSPAGLLEGWYRIWQGDACWYGDAHTEVLDPDDPVDLVWVPNAILPMVVVVEGPEGTERVEMEVGTAVHAQFLVSSLQRRFGLSGRRWALYVEDRAVDPWQILDDFEPEAGFEVRLARG